MGRWWWLLFAAVWIGGIVALFNMSGCSSSAPC